MDAGQVSSWEDYRKCPVCHAEISEPCRVLSGRVLEGRPDGIAVLATRPHIARKKRAGR